MKNPTLKGLFEETAAGSEKFRWFPSADLGVSLPVTLLAAAQGCQGPTVVLWGLQSQPVPKWVMPGIPLLNPGQKGSGVGQREARVAAVRLSPNQLILWRAA